MRISFLLIIFFISNTLCWSQKVALVFSGGGAKGIAHVGVLKALEENEIPIDYIVGTSMGGIVGGFYAGGYSPDEIEHIVLSQEFNDWVNGRPEAGFNYHFYKKESDASMFNIKLAFDESLNARINTSLANDMSLNFALAEKLAQPSANAGNNFDSLMIPLRVVAAEIFTQQTEVIRKGALNNALRATQSVPFFYKPIKINGRYLFDGGIYNNFPIDVAQESFNPDVIIGVNVSTILFEDYPYEEADELISNSLLYMLLDKSDPNKLNGNGIYIEPNLGKTSSFDFHKARQLIDSGYSATMRIMPLIKEKIEARESCEEVATKRNSFNNRNIPLLFSDIKVYDFNEPQKRYIKNLFRANKSGYLTLSHLKKGYFRLMSEPYFENIYPNIVYDSVTNAFILELHGRPKNDLSLDFGGNVGTRNISTIYLGGGFYYFNRFLVNPTFKFYAGNFYKSAQFKSRLYFPGIGHWYLEPEFTYNYWNYLDVNDILINEKYPTILERSDRTYGVNLGIPLGENYKLEIKGAYIYNKDYYSNNRRFSLQDTLDLLNLSGIKSTIEVSHNTLNRKMFANEGKQFLFNISHYAISERYVPGSTSEFTGEITNQHYWLKGQVHLQQYFKKGKFSSGYEFKAVYSSQPLMINEMGTLINQPGFYPLIDSRTLILQKFRSSSFLAAGIINVFELNNNLDLRFEAYAFKSFSSLIDNDERTNFMDYDNPIRTAFTSAFVYYTPVGPLSLNFNYYNDPETNFGVLLNFGYLIFNKPSIE